MKNAFVINEYVRISLMYCLNKRFFAKWYTPLNSSLKKKNNFINLYKKRYLQSFLRHLRVVFTPSTSTIANKKKKKTGQIFFRKLHLCQILSKIDDSHFDMFPCKYDEPVGQRLS